MRVVVGQRGTRLVVVVIHATYRERLEEDQALYDAFHGVAGQAESGAQMAPTLPDERRDAGRRLRGGGCRCGRGGGDQRWRLADGRCRPAADATHSGRNHLAGCPAAAHPHPPLQLRFHQRRTVDDDDGGDNIIRTPSCSAHGLRFFFLPFFSILPVKNRSAHSGSSITRCYCYHYF